MTYCTIPTKPKSSIEPESFGWNTSGYRVTEVRNKILTPLETTGGISFLLEGFEKCFLQFKTLRRVIYIPLQEGFIIFPGVYNSTEGIQMSFQGVYKSPGGIQISFLWVYNSSGGIQYLVMFVVLSFPQSLLFIFI